MFYVSVVTVTVPRGRYTLDYPQAVSECVSRGMDIASRSDPLQARSDGFELCSGG